MHIFSNKLSGIAVNGTKSMFMAYSRLWLTLIGRESDRINTLNIASVFKGLKTVTSDSPCIPGATTCTFSQGPRMLVAFETLTVLQKLPCTKQPQ